MTVIPAEIVLFLRRALYARFARTAGDIDSECSLASPSDMTGPLAEFDRTRALLNAIGWNKKPPQQDDVALDLAVHGPTLIDALEYDRDMSDWLSHQEATESPEGRKRAAANAATIECFLSDLDT
ncbi:MAG TPA: hypothetical protein VFY36_02600 [Solirubrobacteraceae bacterium]|nr:hypothetical protein [Solirubrobacteraceae bacterium]